MTEIDDEIGLDMNISTMGADLRVGSVVIRAD